MTSDKLPTGGAAMKRTVSVTRDSVSTNEEPLKEKKLNADGSFGDPRPRPGNLPAPPGWDCSTPLCSRHNFRWRSACPHCGAKQSSGKQCYNSGETGNSAGDNEAAAITENTESDDSERSGTNIESPTQTNNNIDDQETKETDKSKEGSNKFEENSTEKCELIKNTTKNLPQLNDESEKTVPKKRKRRPSVNKKVNFNNESASEASGNADNNGGNIDWEKESEFGVRWSQRTRKETRCTEEEGTASKTVQLSSSEEENRPRKKARSHPDNEAGIPEEINEIERNVVVDTVLNTIEAVEDMLATKKVLDEDQNNLDPKDDGKECQDSRLNQESNPTPPAVLDAADTNLDNDKIIAGTKQVRVDVEKVRMTEYGGEVMSLQRALRGTSADEEEVEEEEEEEKVEDNKVILFSHGM